MTMTSSVDRSDFQSLYPFESHFLAGPAGRMHYVDEGPSDHQETFLMLHGNPTWSFFYRHLIQAFSDVHRVVAPDHLGCGLSDKPQDFDYTLENHIRNVERLVTSLDLRDITLVVHDWGGAIGMGFAVRHPELIRRIVVLNTAAFPSSRMPRSIALCRIPGLGAFMIRGLNAFSRAALRFCPKDHARMQKEVRAGYVAPYHDWASRVAQLRFVQDIPMTPEHPSYALLEEIGRKISMFVNHPMMIAWGRQDFVFNDHFYAEWRRRFPKAKATVFEDAGHYVLEDAHERIIPLIGAFIDDTSEHGRARLGLSSSSGSRSESDSESSEIRGLERAVSGL